MMQEASKVTLWNVITKLRFKNKLKRDEMK